MADARDSEVWSNHAQECRESGRKPFEITKDDPFRVIAKQLKKNKCKTVLDLGCGPGYWAPVWKGFAYTGFDQNAEMIKLAKEVNPALTFIQADSLDIWHDELFDVVFTAGVLQHNRNEPDKADLLRHIHRLLTPRGYYFFTENTFHVPDVDHTDGYSFTPTGWKKFIEPFGFTFLSYSTANDKYLFQKKMT